MQGKFEGICCPRHRETASGVKAGPEGEGVIRTPRLAMRATRWGKQDLCHSQSSGSTTPIIAEAQRNTSVVYLLVQLEF